MTSQKDLNKDMVALLSSVTDSIHQLQRSVSLINQEVKELNKGYADLSQRMDSQHMKNNNFNDRLINLEENKIKAIDEELKRIDTLEQAFNREF